MKLKKITTRKTRMAKLMCLAFGISGAALPFAAVHAQEYPQTEIPASIDTGMSKTEMPTTKDVLSRSAIEAAIPQDGNDAVKDVAGANTATSQGSANPALTIRGLQLNFFSNFRLNGGLPTTGVISNPTENKEIVEVLKGANALQFGLANPAGIVNYVTKRAKDKDISSVSLSGNSFGQYGLAVDLGRKFGPERQVGIRINASAQHLESGVIGANGRGEFFSIAADLKATDRLSFKLDYENYRKDVIEQAQIGVAKAVAGVINIPAVPNPRTLLSGPWALYTPRTENIDVRADYRISDNWKVMAEVGQSDSSRDRFSDKINFTNATVLTGIGTDAITIIKDQEYHNKFARTELYGKFATGSYQHDLTLGWSSSERGQNIPSTVTAPGQKINIYAPVLRPTAPTSNSPITFAPVVSKDTGPYIYDTIKFARDWRALVGVRKTSYTFVETDPVKFTKTTAMFTPTSPSFGLLYDFAPKSTVYFSYMKSLEDGGTAPAGTTNQFSVLAPTTSQQKEFGVRSSYFDGVRANLAYFMIQRANSVTDVKSNTFLVDGVTDYKGVEATVNARINPQWSLDASGQWMSAAQNPTVDLTLAGKTPVNVPKWIGSLRVTHNLRQIPGLRLSAGVSYVSSRFVDSQDSGSIPGVALLNLGAGYSTKIGGYPTSFQVQVDNLANKRYFNSVNSTSYGIGMDRSVRFNAKVDF